MRTAVYEVISTTSKPNIKIPGKLRLILSDEAIGNQFTLSEILDKYSTSFSGYKTKQGAYNALVNALSIAKTAGLVKSTHKKSDIPEHFETLETVAYWQSQLRGSRFKHSTNKSSTRKQYLYHLWAFNKWLYGKKFQIDSINNVSNDTFAITKTDRSFETVEDLLKVMDQPLSPQKSVIKIIKKYLLDKVHEHKKASTVKIVQSAIMSYFEKNEQSLNLKFDVKVMYNSNEIQEQEISLSDFMTLLSNGKPSVMEKAIFLCKFHKGLDVSTLVGRFNYEAWKQLVAWFGTEIHDAWDLDRCPVPIKLSRIKTGYVHTGFLERDSIEALQRHLKVREEKTGVKMSDDAPLFANKFGRLISSEWVFKHFARLADSSGIQKYTKDQYGKKFFKVDSHELRDLLKSTLIDSGCRIDVADHVIGYKPKDSYEKQSKLYPETLRKEYAKASKRLNIFTKFSSVVNRTDDSDVLKEELNSKIKEVDVLLKQQKEQAIIEGQAEVFMQKQQEDMKNLADTVAKLESQMGSLKKDKPEKLEFCCVDCSTIHDKKACPACGSKIKRIFEDRVQS